VSLHDWSTVGPPFQLGLSRATRFLIGDGKRETTSLRDNPVCRVPGGLRREEPQDIESRITRHGVSVTAE
jgi:hypothetical protein